MNRSAPTVTTASDALSSKQLLEMYYFARLARDVEERLVILFRQSKVIGGLYRSLGQEGESVATAYALERRDADVWPGPCVVGDESHGRAAPYP